MSKRKKLHQRPPRHDGQQPAHGDAPTPRRNREGAGRPDNAAWLFGQHAVLAALANPKRQCRRLLVTPDNKDGVEDALYSASEQGAIRPAPEVVDRAAIERQVPEGAVHQGMALQVSPLETIYIEDMIRNMGETAPALIIVVDQGTDPRNIGAILRSAAAFGADAIVVSDRHSPDVTGVMAKAASGALETVPLVRVTNLSRTLEQLKEAGFWAVGLDGDGNDTIDTLEWPTRAVLVLGAEGKGLRRLTREHCDYLVRIPMTPAMESLNLSNAAAIALYEAYRQRNNGKK